MTTINKEEIQKFSNLADEWWDVNGKFKPLHMFNPIRIQYITEKIKHHFNASDRNNNFLKTSNKLSKFICEILFSPKLAAIRMYCSIIIFM